MKIPASGLSLQLVEIKKMKLWNVKELQNSEHDIMIVQNNFHNIFRSCIN